MFSVAVCSDSIGRCKEGESKGANRLWRALSSVYASLKLSFQDLWFDARRKRRREGFEIDFETEGLKCQLFSCFLFKNRWKVQGQRRKKWDRIGIISAVDTILAYS